MSKLNKKMELNIVNQLAYIDLSKVKIIVLVHSDVLFEARYNFHEFCIAKFETFKPLIKEKSIFTILSSEGIGKDLVTEDKPLHFITLHAILRHLFRKFIRYNEPDEIFPCPSVRVNLSFPKIKYSNKNKLLKYVSATQLGKFLNLDKTTVLRLSYPDNFHVLQSQNDYKIPLQAYKAIISQQKELAC